MDDMKFLTRCLQLANSARGKTAPNPLVGAVVVHNGTIIGEGFHHRAGQGHAEVNAIAAVKNKKLLTSSTLYCSLEPCAHHGKTPPCCELITAHGIPRVVIGTLDPHDQVDGKGIAHMRAHGVEVVLAQNRKPLQQLNEVFWANIILNRPFFTLKWAQSADGFMDADRGAETPAAAISGPLAGINTHKLRAEVDGILIGAKTAQLDRPSLTTRHWSGTNPKPIVLCSKNWQPEKNWLNELEKAPLLVSAEQIEGFETLVCDPYDLQSWVPSLLDFGLYHVLVEGGSTILNAFIAAGLNDRTLRYTSKQELATGVKAPDYTAFTVHNQLGTDSYER